MLASIRLVPGGSIRLLAVAPRLRAACGSESAVKTITVWYPFGGEDGQAMHEIIARFERSHPDIHVKLSFSANSNSSNQKLFLAIAGGTPPDVTFVGGQQVTEWSPASGALADITDQARQAGPGPDDYRLPSCECTPNGQTHALPLGQRPHSLSCGTKDVPRGRPGPRAAAATIEELDEFNHRLTKIDARGPNPERRAHSVTWRGYLDVHLGLCLWGDFYVLPPAESMDMVSASPPTIRAMSQPLAGCKATRSCTTRKISAFNSNFVGVANNPFYLGKEACA